MNRNNERIREMFEKIPKGIKYVMCIIFIVTFATIIMRTLFLQSKSDTIPVQDILLIEGNKEENQHNQLSYPKAEIINISMYSPDTKYCAETYGANTDVTAGGLIPAEKIRIREISSGNIVWEMIGYYDCNILWSSDSNNVAISYTARIYGETVIVNTNDFSEILVPIPDEIQKNFRNYRPDSYVVIDKWIDNEKLAVNIQYTGADELNYSGSYVFNPATGEITDLDIDN